MINRSAHMALVLALGLGLGAPPNAAAAPASNVAQVTFSAQEAETALRDQGLTFERLAPKAGVLAYRVTFLSLGGQGLGGHLVFTAAKDSPGRYGAAQAHAGFESSMARTGALDLVNTWNRRKRFSRAWVDDQDDPHLEADLSFDGGVSRQALGEFLATFKASMLMFTAEVASK